LRSLNAGCRASKLELLEKDLAKNLLLFFPKQQFLPIRPANNMNKTLPTVRLAKDKLSISSHDNEVL
jgi:hypothetical protein